MRVFDSRSASYDDAPSKRKLAALRSEAVPARQPAPSVSPVAAGFVQRKASCACGGGCGSCQGESLLQPKLSVSTPGDAFEQEADRAAEQVTTAGVSAPKVNIAGRVPASQPQRKCAACEGEQEEGLQAKGVAGHAPHVNARTQTQIDSLRSGGGRPLPREERVFFESRFGQDFGGVRVHADARAAESARAVEAVAYTVGRDIVFGAGQYEPGTTEGRKLLAHELAHVVQQGGAGAMLQRQHVAPTGFVYTPPPAVTRSIIEIQGIVGSTPDGVYAEDTRRAVEKYQTKLTSAGIYTGRIDGLWGEKTDLAHIAFAISSTTERKSYNCAGFAFKKFIDIDLPTTKAEYAKMTKLADCTKPCKPYYHKFWMWEFDIKVRQPSTGATTRTWHDFHTVGGQTDASGNGPDNVMSKDGQRPVVGPKPPIDWKPKAAEPVLDSDNNVVADREWLTWNMTEDCYCSDKLP